MSALPLLTQTENCTQLKEWRANMVTTYRHAILPCENKTCPRSSTVIAKLQPLSSSSKGWHARCLLQWLLDTIETLIFCFIVWGSRVYTPQVWVPSFLKRKSKIFKKNIQLGKNEEKTCLLSSNIACRLQPCPSWHSFHTNILTLLHEKSMTSTPDTNNRELNKRMGTCMENILRPKHMSKIYLHLKQYHNYIYITTICK